MILTDLVFRPEIIGEYPAHACAALPTGIPINFKIIAQSNCPNVSITDINIVGPAGSIHSAIAPYGTSGNQWYTNVSWTPTTAQLGANLVCSTATDEEYSISPVVCYTFLVSLR